MSEFHTSSLLPILTLVTACYGYPSKGSFSDTGDTTAVTDTADTDDTTDTADTSVEDCTITVEEHVEIDTEWGGDCNTIYVAIDLEVSAALTILPGTTVVFAEGKEGILVQQQGSLNAVGTESLPISFEGEVQTKGWWGGLSILSITPENRLEHVTIRDNGAVTFQFEPYSLFIGGYGADKGRMMMSNVDFINSSGPALTVWGGGSIEGSENVSFTDIDGIPLTISFAEVHQLNDTFTFDSSLPHRFVLFTRETIDAAVTWQALDVPYQSDTDQFFIGDNGFLTVKAGTTIAFGPDHYLSTDDGKMAFRGTADNPIVLTGREEIPGYWGGLTYESMSTDNVLEHTVIDYAGGDNFEWREFALIVPSGYVQATDLTIRNSGGGGVLLRNGGTIDQVNPITYENIAGDEFVDDN